MTGRLSRRLPAWAIALSRKARAFARSIYYRGRGRWCPVCGRESRKFGSYGVVRRADAQCVHCGALERHRFIWLYLSGMTNLFDGSPRQVLHVAPEECFEPRLRARLGPGYVTADLLDPRAMVRMDITDIQYPDEHFDVIYCSHVLEHVPDDGQALREFQRVLKRGGWAILVVPITAQRTIENPSVTDPNERLRLFGQADHVRRYGPDFVERLRVAGFQVKTSRARELFDAQAILRMGLPSAAGEIHFCTRR